MSEKKYENFKNVLANKNHSDQKNHFQGKYASRLMASS